MKLCKHGNVLIDSLYIASKAGKIIRCLNMMCLAAAVGAMILVLHTVRCYCKD